MSNDTLNKIEELDLQIREIFLNAPDEKTIENAIKSYTFTMTAGNMWVDKRSYGRRRDDGTIFMNGKGLAPIGINESKYANNGKRIGGSLINATFAQAMSYYNESVFKTHKFAWLSHNEWFILIKLEDNKDLLNKLLVLYNENPEIPPYLSYTIPGIRQVFEQTPLVIYKEWTINSRFRFSEVIEETLKIIE